MYLYSAIFVVPRTQGAQAWITQCYLQLHQCPPLPRKRSPDGASPDWGCTHLIAAYYSFIYPGRMKGWVGLVGWPTPDGLPTSKWSHVCCRSNAGQGKFADQRPTFYHCTTQPRGHLLPTARRVCVQELSYCRGWPTVREQLKRLCLHRRCVEYLATGNFYLLA